MGHYFDLVVYKAWAELKSEASRYYISYLWWILGPVLEMTVYYLVFAVLMRRGTNQFICFLIIGIILWNWFNASVQHCSNAITGSRSLIQKVTLPKIIFPVIVLLVDTFKFILSFVIIMAFIYIFGLFQPPVSFLSIFFLLYILFTELIFIASVGFFCAAIVPFLPDLTIIISYGLRLMFFLSGIFYDGRKLPEAYQKWFFLNPMARIIDDARSILIRGDKPDLFVLTMILGAAFLCMMLGVWLIHQFDREYPRVLAQ